MSPADVIELVRAELYRFTPRELARLAELAAQEISRHDADAARSLYAGLGRFRDELDHQLAYGVAVARSEYRRARSTPPPA